MANCSTCDILSGIRTAKENHAMTRVPPCTGALCSQHEATAAVRCHFHVGDVGGRTNWLGDVGTRPDGTRPTSITAAPPGRAAWLLCMSSFWLRACLRRWNCCLGIVLRMMMQRLENARRRKPTRRGIDEDAAIPPDLRSNSAGSVGAYFRHDPCDIIPWGCNVASACEHTLVTISLCVRTSDESHRRAWWVAVG